MSSALQHVLLECGQTLILPASLVPMSVSPVLLIITARLASRATTLVRGSVAWVVALSSWELLTRFAQMPVTRMSSFMMASVSRPAQHCLLGMKPQSMGSTCVWSSVPQKHTLRSRIVCHAMLRARSATAQQTRIASVAQSTISRMTRSAN